MRWLLVSTALLCACPAAKPATRAGSVEAAKEDPLALLSGYRADDSAPAERDERVVEVVAELREAQRRGSLGARERSALFELFTRLRVSTPRAKHRDLFRQVYRLLLEISDPAWEDAAIERIRVPIASLQQEHESAVVDQVYWQTTAAELLGRMRSTKAVPALLEVMSSPFKGSLASTALVALVSIGMPALELAIRFVDGEEPALREYAEREQLRALRDQDAPLDDAAREGARWATSATAS
jgi:hypothetical protein